MRNRTPALLRAARWLAAAMTIPAAPGLADEPADGGRLYAEYCSVCHGDRGDGNSRARHSMVPPPRDFTTPEAAVELSRARMIDAVAQGRPGTAMAGWATQLDERQIAAVVDHIRTRFMLPAATGDAEHGRRLYAENCSVCHGDDGAGARWATANMSPPPRDFTSATAANELDRDRMVASVTYGRADSAMPGFGSQLAEADIAAVVDYVRSAFLTTREASAAAQQPPPAPLDAAFGSGLTGDAARGEAFYIANCAICHGAEGDGKGPRAYFILPKPRNFRHPASRHRLNRPTLYEAIAKGRLRTEMPAWETVLGPQEIADVAEYVFQAFVSPGEPAR